MFVCCETARRDGAPSLLVSHEIHEVREYSVGAGPGAVVRATGSLSISLSDFFIHADSLSDRGKFASLDTEESLAGHELIGEQLVAFLK